MAKRIATEYVKSSLNLTEAELLKFIEIFEDEQRVLLVKVFENGNQQIIFRDNAEDEVVFSFELSNGKYISEGSCRVSNPQLTNLMRKAVSDFKGNAIVNRIYSDFTMVYYYERGLVVKIVEMIGSAQKVIYEYTNTANVLEQWFHNQKAEEEIQETYRKIDKLLDLRIESGEKPEHTQIDLQLQRLTHKLFVLEA
ncbi:MAG TPA: non-ribosomal peptide synthetase module [Bacilli bacterium]